jgi:ComF family protein
MTDQPAPISPLNRPCWLGGSLRAAVDFVFPPACPFCRRELAAGEDLCDPCREELAGSLPDVCLRCSAPVGPHLHTGQGCIHCRGDSYAFDRALAIGAYDARLRLACLQAKRDSSGRIVRALTDLMFGRWQAELNALNVDVIVPVPAHWTSRFLRAAAPAEAVALRLARLLRRPCDLHTLRKRRRTPQQSSLPPSQRRENLRNAFAVVRGVRLDGVRVLLVDDVLTTGTTAHRGASVLKQAGAERVTVAVLARGIGR